MTCSLLSDLSLWVLPQANFSRLLKVNKTKLYGTEGWVRDNAKTVNYSVRGANTQTTRIRQHLAYIEKPNNVH